MTYIVLAILILVALMLPVLLPLSDQPRVEEWESQLSDGSLLSVTIEIPPGNTDLFIVGVSDNSGNVFHKSVTVRPLPGDYFFGFTVMEPPEK